MRFSENSWKKVPFKDIASFHKGNGLSKEQLSNVGKECILYGELYTKYVPGPINDIVSKTNSIPLNVFYSKKNDIILPSSGESNLDISTACCVQKDNVILGGDLNVIRSNEHDGSFLCYQLIGKRKLDIAKIAQGASIVHLHNSDLEKLHLFIPFCSDDELKIAEILNLISIRITTQKKIIDKLKSLIKWINDKHFSNIRTYFKFSDLYTSAKEGGTPDTKKECYYLNGNIPFIKIDDLYDKYITKHKNCITSEGLNNSSAWIIPENSVIYSNGATIGEVSINRYPVATKQGILGIIPNDLISSEYFYYLLKSKYFKKEICKITTKGTMDAAYIKDIDKISCPTAIKEHQIIYTTKINNLFNKIEIEKKILHLYEKQKQYLLNKLFI